MLSARELAPEKNSRSTLGQPAAHVHPRHRRRDGAGQRGDAEACPTSSSAICRRCRCRRADDHPAADLLRRAARDYVIVGARQPEFDYPAGTGSSGTARRAPARLVRHDRDRPRFDADPAAVRGAVPRPEPADQRPDHPQSQLLMHRSLNDRLELVAPFLRFDNDPYLVVGDDGPPLLHPGRVHDQRPVPERPAGRRRDLGPTAAWPATTSTTSATA